MPFDTSTPLSIKRKPSTLRPRSGLAQAQGDSANRQDHAREAGSDLQYHHNLTCHNTAIYQNFYPMRAGKMLAGELVFERLLFL